jgi:hypothetical protein
LAVPARSNRPAVAFCWASLFALAMAASARSQEGGEEEEVSISDNSFLVEEAYNQQQGVV